MKQHSMSDPKIEKQIKPSVLLLIATLIPDTSNTDLQIQNEILYATIYIDFLSSTTSIGWFALSPSS